MKATTPSPRTCRPVHSDAATHLYAVGQLVRLKGGFMPRSKTAGVYHITGLLPDKERSPQYRIRSASEIHERVASQDNLESLGSSSRDEAAGLVERTFGHG